MHQPIPPNQICPPITGTPKAETNLYNCKLRVMKKRSMRLRYYRLSPDAMQSPPDIVYIGR